LNELFTYRYYVPKVITQFSLSNLLYVYHFYTPWCYTYTFLSLLINACWSYNIAKLGPRHDKKILINWISGNIYLKNFVLKFKTYLIVIVINTSVTFVIKFGPVKYCLLIYFYFNLEAVYAFCTFPFTLPKLWLLLSENIFKLVKTKTLKTE
jgi:hypothetical protein